MRVVQATRFGGPEVLETSEAPNPVAGPGQVVIGVAVADVLFVDTQIRRGWHREYFTVTPPYVPGAGVAGRCAAWGRRGAARPAADAVPSYGDGDERLVPHRGRGVLGISPPALWTSRT